MSVDGVILSDLKRWTSFHAPAAAFMAVVGSEGAGRSTVIRAVVSGASANGLGRLDSARDCFITGGSDVQSEAEESVGQAYVFHATPYDLQDMCSWVSTTPEARVREKLVLVLEDLPSMWELSRIQDFTSSFLHLLEKIKRTAQCALLTSATSTSSLPTPLLDLARFVSYPVLPMTAPGCRLFLQSFMPVRSNRTALKDRAVLDEHIAAAVTPHSTRRSVAMAHCMVQQYIGSVKTYNSPQHESVWPGTLMEKIPAAVVPFLETQQQYEDRSDSLGTVGMSKPLYGLASLLDRLDMLLNVFMGQTDSEVHRTSGLGSGRVLNSIGSTTGILLHGPSGCGKSAVVHQLHDRHRNAPFFFVRCTSLFSQYLGESEQRLREVYRKARSASPAVVVLEDVDVIALSRGAMNRSSEGSGGGVNVSTRMLAVLLCELDGLASNAGVLTIGTTNAPDAMDAAVLRQGRLETLLFTPPLSLEAAEEMCTAFLNRFEGDDVTRSRLLRMVAPSFLHRTPASLAYFFRRLIESSVLTAGGPLQGLWSLPSETEVNTTLKACLTSSLCHPVAYSSSLLV